MELRGGYAVSYTHTVSFSRVLLSCAPFPPPHSPSIGGVCGREGGGLERGAEAIRS